jgi:hypothetical protein
MFIALLAVCAGGVMGTGMLVEVQRLLNRWFKSIDDSWRMVRTTRGVPGLAKLTVGKTTLLFTGANP